MTRDVIVIGGGVMGCTVALRLAQAGLSVTVLEQSIPGAEASSVAAGILGPAVESHAPGIGLELGLRSRERHLELAEELREEHGIDVGFRRCGVMKVAFGIDDRTAIDAQAQMLAQQGVRIERLSGDEARKREPSLSPDVVAAFDLPDEAQVDPRTLLRAVAIAAERAGATFRTGAAVRGIVVEGDRVVGVSLEGETLEAPKVVVCAGSWTSLVPGLALPKDAIFPVRGQIVATSSRPPVFRRIVFGAGGYVVTRPDGRVLSGSTEERVGYRRDVTLGGLAKILRTATTLAPVLADAPVEGYWSSFRPGTRDRLPLIGEAGAEGLVVASGHYRNGILLSAITADLVRDLVVEGKVAPELEPLSPLRLGRESAS